MKALEQDLREQIRRGKALIIAGAGVSIGATRGAAAASWPGLLESGVARCEELVNGLPPGWADCRRAEVASPGLGAMISAAEQVTRELGGPRSGEYSRWLRETVGSFVAEDTATLEALRDLAFVHQLPIATTNYDGLLEKTTGHRAITWLEPAKVQRVLRGDDDGILHLHGFWDEPESVVLGLRSYDALLGSVPAQTLQQVLALTHSFVFVGCGAGLQDPNFSALLDWLRQHFGSSEYRHFRLCLAREEEELGALHAGDRVYPVPFGDHHDDLPGFLRGLMPHPMVSAGRAGAEAAVPAQGASASTIASLRPPGLLRHLLDRLLPRLHLGLTRLGSLPEPPELPTVRRCLEELRARMEEENQAYLPLAARDVKLPASERHLARQELGQERTIRRVRQLIRQVLDPALGGDAASAQIAAINRRNKVVRDLIRTLLRAPDPLVLLGDPGTGKSMTLRETGRLLAERELRRAFPRVVVFVRLADFAPGGDPSAEAVAELVRKAAPPTLRPLLPSLEDSGRLVVLFDGMDEMSRQGYNARVEALSDYALARRDRVKTLFSCRINDFSPRFRHRQLVLLPFDRGQVTRYLRRNMDFPVEIGGERWTARGLAKRLLRGPLPLEASNPFNLFLLRIYLYLKRSWPSSRADLLGFYFEQNHEHYRQRAEKPEEFPPREACFRSWAVLAYELTRRDRGSALAHEELPEVFRGLDAGQWEAGMEAGLRCGVLTEDEGADRPSLRFEHHRFQEYFAALHVHQEQPLIDWLVRLDAPRWQETLLNLVSLGGAGTAVGVLARVLDDDLAGVRVLWSAARIDEARLAKLEKVRSYLAELPKAPSERSEILTKLRGELAEEGTELTWDDEKVLSQAKAFVDAAEEEKVEIEEHLEDVRRRLAPAERRLADRIELSSRIIKDGGGATDEELAGGLQPAFERGLQALAKQGNPSTQVKMLWASRNVPEIDLLEILRTPLRSPLAWVRDQAVAVLASEGAQARRVGSDLATEMAHDLGGGVFLNRWKTYWRALQADPRPRWWYCFTCAGLCSLLGLLCLFALSALGYAALLPESPWLQHPGPMAAFGGAVLLCGAYGIWRRPGLSWAWILGSAVGSLAVITGVERGLAGQLFEVVGLAIGLPLIGLFLLPILVFAGHFASLLFFLAATWPLRSRQESEWSILTSAAERTGLGFVPGLLGLLAVMAVIAGVPVLLGVSGVGDVLEDLLNAGWSTLLRFGDWLGGSLSLPFAAVVNLALALVVAVALAIAARAAMQRSWRPFQKAQDALLFTVLMIPLLAGMLVLFGGGAMLLEWLLEVLPRTTFWAYLAFTVAIVLLLGGTLGLGYLLYDLWRARLRALRPFPAGSWKAGAWRQHLAGLPGHHQDGFLRRTDHQSLSLSAREFHDLLIDVETTIQEDAASAYWQKRHELDLVLRQERRG